MGFIPPKAFTLTLKWYYNIGIRALYVADFLFISKLFTFYHHVFLAF